MTDLFNDDQTNSGNNQPNPNSGTDDLLAELVGEGKKFKTVNDLARSKVEADRFIEQLKSESAEMRAQMTKLEGTATKQRTIEDILNAVKEVRGDEGNQPPVTTEDILKAIDHRVLQLDHEKSRRANAEVAQSELLKRFKGDEAKAKEFIRTEAQRVGLTPSELKGLSETSPEAFKRILGLSNPTGSGTGPSFNSEVNTSSAQGGTTRNAAYYSELKAKLGPRFWDPAIQQQRFKDRQALGTKFFE